MSTKFSSLPWHDAILKSIIIDRKNPGNIDQVILEIEWPNFSKSKIIFDQCYELNISMNFGVVASESILEALEITKSIDIDNIRKKWAVLGSDLQSLRCFEIKTNSTSSLIRIFSIEVTVTET